MHPEMDKSSRKKLCRVLNCRKLSETASMHAAQNELLPLRIVVQVLFFEKARAAAQSGPGGAHRVACGMAGQEGRQMARRPRPSKVSRASSAHRATTAGARMG